MNLHKENEVFQELVEATAIEFNLQPFQVEKDYYVSLKQHLHINHSLVKYNK